MSILEHRDQVCHASDTQVPLNKCHSAKEEKSRFSKLTSCIDQGDGVVGSVDVGKEKRLQDVKMIN